MASALQHPDADSGSDVEAVADFLDELAVSSSSDSDGDGEAQQLRQSTAAAAAAGAAAAGAAPPQKQNGSHRVNPAAGKHPAASIGTPVKAVGRRPRWSNAGAGSRRELSSPAPAAAALPDGVVPAVADGAGSGSDRQRPWAAEDLGCFSCWSAGGGSGGDGGGSGGSRTPKDSDAAGAADGGDGPDGQGPAAAALHQAALHQAA